MRTILLVHSLILILSISQSSGIPRPAKAETFQAPARPHVGETGITSNDLAVSLHAASGATILFRANNGKEVTSPGDPDRNIPYLVLSRNGVPTPHFERTLHLAVENLQVPASGLYVGLVIETQHDDPDLVREHSGRILVWEEKRFLPSSPDHQQTSVDFTILFQRALQKEQQSVQTPTDYYSYRITLWDSQGNILRILEEKYAFLLENQLEVPLPRLLEASPGAAPKKLVIYYYDMIPFQSRHRDPETRIPRRDVERYIQTELVPAMVEAIVVQSNIWKLPWYEEWTSPRTDEDPKILSVALGERGTWFHGKAPSLAHAMISIRVDGTFGEYENLTDGIMSVFHHELFHNQQRNISLHFGSKGSLLGKEAAWDVFSEGTAVLASSVGQPGIQFEPMARSRNYMERANAFIGSASISFGALNTSYRKVPYQTAIYWRFLYESCGGVRQGVEDPGIGMAVIRSTLETLFSGEIADINTSVDVTRAFPRILDAALQKTPTCPFRSYEESLVRFARAIYQLRLAEGRCRASEQPMDCGFFDPSHLYAVPGASIQPVIDGSARIDGNIPSSFGIDLIEIPLGSSTQGKPLKIIFQATSTPQDEFHVELQVIQTGTGGSRRAAASPQDGRLEAQTAGGHLILEIPAVDLDSYNGLGIIITRLDAGEGFGSEGKYLIQVAHR